jgi:hypothetical protein
MVACTQRALNLVHPLKPPADPSRRERRGGFAVRESGRGGEIEPLGQRARVLRSGAVRGLVPVPVRPRVLARGGHQRPAHAAHEAEVCARVIHVHDVRLDCV